MRKKTYYAIEILKGLELHILQFSSSRAADTYVRKANAHGNLYSVSVCTRERISARELRDLLIDELTYVQCEDFQRVDFRCKSLSELIMMYNYYKYNGYSDFAEEVQ